ncbi:hypothetical protein PsYK624_131970 [Phanerochaete sordida]|uniref:Uncharacterized protein n=1 Tax=Phanerochaete sordida TaxID=48140 RepID=A0A9P3LK82_9APHY|nr:hypothetical protein PsYK624_131970 [Phanerochaete sordida]
MSLTSEPPVGTHLAGHRVPPPDSDFHLLPDTLRPEKRGQPDVDHAEGPTQKAARTNASSASIQPVSGGTFSTSQVNDLRDAAKRRRKRYMEGRQTTAPAVTQQVPLAERIRVLEGERRAEEDSRRAAEGAKDELRKKLHTLSQRVAEVDHCEKNADAEGRAWQAEGLALETKLSALRRESSAALKEHVAEFDQVAKGKGKKKQEWDAERFALEDKLAAVQQESSAVVEKRLTWFERTISSMQHDLSVALELRTELERAKVSSEKEKQAWQMEKLSLEDKLATLQRERRAGLEQHTAELDRVQKGKELLAQRVSELESAERRTDAERQTWKTERVALENTLAQRTSELERAVKTRDQEKVAWRAEKLALEASHAAVTQEKEVAQRAKEGLRQELLQAMEKNVQLFSAQAKDAAGILLRLQEQTRLDAGHQVSGSPDSTSPS